MNPTDADGTNPHADAGENERFAAFRAFLELEGLSAITCACYASDWWNVSERVRAAQRRRFRLDRFTSDDFLLYRADQAARGVAAATLNRRLAFLRRYADFAATAEPPCGALAESLRRLPYQPVKPPTSGALSPDDEERLAEAAERLGATEHALVLFLVRTGVRAADAASILRRDVSGPPDAPVSVRVHARGDKTIVLPPRTSKAIGTLLESEPGAPGDPLFRAKGRYALGEAGVAAVVGRAARESGVRATPRTLRHTFAVRYLAEHRDDVEGLAKAFGPSSAALVRAWRDEAGAGANRDR